MDDKYIFSPSPESPERPVTSSPVVEVKGRDGVVSLEQPTSPRSDPWDLPEHEGEENKMTLFNPIHRGSHTFVKDHYVRYERLTSSDSTKRRYDHHAVNGIKTEATSKGTSSTNDESQSVPEKATQTTNPGLRKRNADDTKSQSMQTESKHSRIPLRKMHRAENKDTDSGTDEPTKSEPSLTLKKMTGKYILERLAKRYAFNPEYFDNFDGDLDKRMKKSKDEKKMVLKATNNSRVNNNKGSAPTVPRYIDHGQIPRIQIPPKPRQTHAFIKPSIRKQQSNSPVRVTLNSAEKCMAGPRRRNIENWVINAMKNTPYGKYSTTKPDRVRFAGPNVRRKVKRRKRFSDNHGSYPRKGRGSYASSKSTKSVGYQSEIPVINYSDDDDGHFIQPRPLTDTVHNRYPAHRRYEPDNENEHHRINFRGPPLQKMGRTSGALVRFYINGDVDHRGLQIVVNRRNYRNLSVLLKDLNDRIQPKSVFNHIFKFPEGVEITSVTDFQNRCIYLASNTKVPKLDLCYGESREQPWSNKAPSAGRLRKTEQGLYQRPPSPKNIPPSSQPYIVTIINNLSRDKREKVILNPQTTQTFEEWLSDINCPDIPVRTLYTEKPPHTQVASFSLLFRELKIHSNFIACGEELLPLELTKKRQAPSSNSSSDSISDRGRKKKQSRQYDMGQIHEYGRPPSPTSTAMSRYDTGPLRQYPPGFIGRGRAIDSRRQPKDTVALEINGIVREFIPPSYANPYDDGLKPEVTLKTEWVYGFGGKNTRHNLLVLPRTGELMYHVASVVILYDKDRDMQRLYTKHNEEVTCMTLHPNQYLVATGQLHGTQPEHAAHIRIWDSVSLSTYSIIGVTAFHAGIVSIGFSCDSSAKYMCALDASDKHVLSIWEWQRERIIARTTTSVDPVHSACFYPNGEDSSVIISYGIKHIYFWKVFYDYSRKKDARILRDRNSGCFENEVPDRVNCIAFMQNGEVLSGDSNGTLMIWERDSTDAFICRSTIKAHKYPVQCLCMLEDGTVLSAAGGEINAWDATSNFRSIKSREVPHEAGDVKAIVPQTTGGIDGRLYIGTSHSCILEGCMQTKFRYVVQGHYDGVWGVVAHPVEPTFVTAGMDQVVFKWSLLTHKVIWRTPVQAPCTCVAIDHRHELVALGTMEGSVIILNAYNGMHVNNVEVGNAPVNCLAYSPDGGMLALGSSDGTITIFTVMDRGRPTDFRRPVWLRGHSSGVCNLDWSCDGRCLQSIDEDFDLLFWDVDSRQQITIPRIMRDVDWFTNSCCAAYSSIGPWSNLGRGEVLKAVCRSNYRDYMLTGDNKGRVRLYKYPCSQERADFREVRHYSSEVTAVALSPDNRLALTCGGNDCALIQWALLDPL